MYETIIRERLIELRNTGGYSQKKLETLTGISCIKIAKVETGAQKPDVEIIGELSKFYNVSTDYIFGLSKN